MFDFEGNYQRILSIKERECWSWAQVAKEMDIAWNTLLHIQQKGRKNYKDLAPKTKAKVKRFLIKYEDANGNN